MKKLDNAHRILGLIGVVFAITAAMPAVAGSDAQQQDLANQVLKQLEDSGALDQAIDRAVERRVKHNAEMREKAELERRSQMNAAAKNVRKVDPARDHIFGNAGARYSVILYSDLECPYCKRFAGIPEAAVANFDSQVNVVWRHFPLEMHGATALREAYASECVARQAGNAGFFAFANSVMRATQANGQGLADGDAGVLKLAKEAGVKNVGDYKKCLADAEVKGPIDEDMKDGAAGGIEGTPGVILRDNLSGNSLLVGGAIPEPELEAQIKTMIEAKPAS